MYATAKISPPANPMNSNGFANNLNAGRDTGFCTLRAYPSSSSTAFLSRVCSAFAHLSAVLSASLRSSAAAVSLHHTPESQ